MEILKVLVKEGMQQLTGYPGVQSQKRVAETEETIEEQGLLARLTHLIQSSDNDTQFQVGGYSSAVAFSRLTCHLASSTCEESIR